MNSRMINPLNAQLSQALNRQIMIASVEEIKGGCINQAAILHTNVGDYFVKYNAGDMSDMFEQEAVGLKLIADTQTMRVPQSIGITSGGQYTYLIMEYLDLTGRADMQHFANQLATMHRVTADAFGNHHDNYIGSTPQINQWQDNWVDFWREQRLGYQLNLIKQQGQHTNLLESGYRLMENIDVFFTRYQPQASLLHGDLWSGNYGFTSNNEPVIYDPAVYYGDRETDIAMTELFGGFSPDFYATYQHDYPLDQDYPVRKTLYNLYHILNHVNLFGGSYAQQAQGMMDQLLSEIKG